MFVDTYLNENDIIMLIEHFENNVYTYTFNIYCCKGKKNKFTVELKNTDLIGRLISG